MLLDVPYSHVVTTFGKPVLDEECNATWKVGRARIFYSTDGDTVWLSGPDDATQVVCDILVKTPVTDALKPGTPVRIHVQENFLQTIFKNNIFIICHDNTLFNPKTLDTSWRVWDHNRIQSKVNTQVYTADFEILEINLETIFS